MVGIINQVSLPKQVEQKIESLIEDDSKQDYMEAVVHGMKLASRRRPDGTTLMGSLAQSKDPVQSCAIGAINLTLILNKESRGTMPPNVIPMVAITLMCQALDFAVEAKILPTVTTADIDRGTHLVFNQIMVATHMTNKKFKMISEELHGILQDPSKVQQMQLRSGTVKHPDAVTPTPGIEPQGQAQGAGNGD